MPKLIAKTMASGANATSHIIGPEAKVIASPLCAVSNATIPVSRMPEVM